MKTHHSAMIAASRATAPSMPPKSRPSTSTGFSLIELMVTLLVVSILMAVAVPSYKSSVRKSRRTEAKTALLDLAGREERFYTTNNGIYSTSPVILGYSSTVGATFPMLVGNSYYQVNITRTAGSAGVLEAFTATAAPQGDQATDPCGTFQLTSTGAQTPTTAGCW